MFPVPAKTVFLLAIAVFAPYHGCSLKVSSQAEEDSCACLKWKDVYGVNGGKYNGKCAFTGREMAHDMMGVINPEMAKEFCLYFFEHIDDNFCVNWNYEAPVYYTRQPEADWGQQWCYVSSECKNLGNGTKILGRPKLAMKTCTSDDKKLSAYSATELADLAVEQNVDLALLAKFAWDVPAMWTKTSHSQIEAVKKSGVTKLYDSADGHPPFDVISGGSHYKIDFLPKPDGMQAFEESRFGKMNGLTCVEGC